MPTDEYEYRGRTIRIVENGDVQAFVDGAPIVVQRVPDGYWTTQFGFRTFDSVRELVEALVDRGG